MALAIKIRPVRSGDWNRFQELVAGICTHHGDTAGLTRAQFDAMAVGYHAPVTTLVAETDDGQLAGFVAGHPVYNFAQGETAFEIQNLFVAEQFRRQGVGEVLMINIMQAARQRHDVARFKIGAQNWNKAAIRFYQQLGFDENTMAKETMRLTKLAA